MDSDQGKLFIGGISWETDETKLQEYFSFYGDVSQTVVMRDKATGRPRGFGFVVFSDPALLDKVLADQHVIDGRTVEAKRALSRDEQQTSVRSGNGGSAARNFGNGGNVRTKKIFVGGLPATITDDGFRQYFEAYGTVTDVVVMFDQQTQRPRGFGFVSFDDEDAVDRVLHKTFHDLNGKQVEVKKALPKDGNSSGGGGGGRSMGGAGTGGGGGGGGGYQGYGGSGSYTDTNRYMQSQNTGAGFQGYGSSGYGAAAGYGYGPGNTAGFGAYGGYGAANPGYGAPTSAAYGNPNASSGGYGGPQGASRGSGYGAVGYGNAAAPWSGPGGGVGGVGGGAASGQSPGGGAYGYGGMDGSYANQAPYGAVGGRSGSVPSSNVPAGGVDMPGGGGGGYMGGGGYGDTNGNSAYGNQGWRSDPTQASANYGGYGGGYGAPARQ